MNQPDDRLLRIEEAQAFTERTLDQLHEELLRAFRELDGLSKRIERLERRLTSVEEAAAEDQDQDSPE